MAAFQNVKEFDEELQRQIKRFGWNFDAGSYEELKRNPSAYNFFEEEYYIRFFIKDRKVGRIERILIITAISPEGYGDVTLRNVGIGRQDLNFLNRIVKDDKWWL